MGLLLVAITVSSAGISGAVAYIHVDAPNDIQLGPGNKFTVRVKLTDQQGAGATGRSYGDATTPNSWYIAGLRTASGTAASINPDIANFQELGDGLYEIPVEVVSWAPGDTTKQYRLEVRYVGSVTPENATLDYYLTDTVTVSAEGAGAAGSLKYFELQPDEISVENGKTIHLRTKLTDQTGNGINTINPGAISVARAVYEGGGDVSATIGSVSTLGHGEFDIPVTVNDTAGGTLNAITVKYVYNDFEHLATVGFEVNGSSQTAPANPMYTDPYLISTDTTGPVTSISSLFPPLSNGRRAIDISGSTTDENTGNVAIQSAEYFIDTIGADGAGTGVSVQNSVYSGYSINLSANYINSLPDGVHTVYVHARDAKGNWGDYASTTFNVDHTMPSTDISAPTENQWLKGLFTVQGSTYNPFNRVIDKVEVYFDNGPWLLGAGVGNWDTWSYSLDTTGLSDGLHNVRSKVTTGGTAEIPFFGIPFFVDNTPPVSLISKPVNGSGAAGSLTVKGTASDNNLTGWSLDIGAGASPGSWTPVANGTSNKLGVVKTLDATADFTGSTLTNVEVIDPGWVRPLAGTGAEVGTGKYAWADNSYYQDGYWSTYLPTMANDGDNGTRWKNIYSSSTPANSFVTVDLGSPQYINRVYFRDSFAAQPDFQIWGSLTGEFAAGDKIVLDTVVGNSSATVDRTFANTKVRYVRINWTKIWAAKEINIYDLKIYAGSYYKNGEMISKVQDAGSVVNWNGLTRNAVIDPGAGLEIRVRTGNTPIPDGTWSDWSEAVLGAAGNFTLPAGRYAQAKATFASEGNARAMLDNLSLYAGEDLGTVDTTSLSNGTYTLRLHTVDRADNQVDSFSTFTVDNNLPSVSITSPSDGQEIPGRYTVTGTASSISPIQKVEMSIDGGVYQLVYGTSSWSYSLDTMGFASGSTHTIKARVTNSIGVSAESAPVSVTVNNLPPLINITSPVFGTWAGGVAPVSVRGTITGLNPVVQYTVYTGTGYNPAVWTAVYNGSGAVPVESVLATWDASGYNPYTVYTIRVAARDSAGNITNTDVPVWFDTVAPFASLGSITRSGTNLTLGIKVQDRYWDHWEIEYGQGTTAVSYVYWQRGTQQSTGNSPGFSDVYLGPFSVAGWAQGPYTFKVIGVDKGGNRTESTKQFAIDYTPPTVNIDAPTDGRIYTNKNMFPMTVSYTDNISISNSPYPTASVDGKSWNASVASTVYPQNGVVVGWVDPAGWADGTYTARMKVFDNGGNLGEHTHNFYIDTNEVPSSAEITSPIPGSTVAGIVYLQGTAFDPVSGVSSVRISIDNGAYQNVTGTNNWSYTWDVSGYVNLSNHTVKLWVVDRAGWSSVQTFNYTIDTVKPTVTGITPADGSTGNSEESTIRIYFSEPVQTSTLPMGITVTDNTFGGPVLGTLEYYSSGNYVEFTPSLVLHRGSYTVNVADTVKDLAGNNLQAAATSTFNVADLIATIDSPVEGSYVSGNVYVYGSAYSASLTNYQLAYEAAGAPGVWNVIGTYTAPVGARRFYQTAQADFAAPGGNDSYDINRLPDNIALKYNTVTMTGASGYFDAQQYPTGNLARGKKVERSGGVESIDTAQTDPLWQDWLLTDGAGATDSLDNAIYYLPANNGGVGATVSANYIVDLGAEATINSASLISGGLYNSIYQADSVTVYTSMDKVTWASRGTASKAWSAIQQTLTVNFSPAAARYVKWVWSDYYYNSSYYPFIKEVKVNGSFVNYTVDNDRIMVHPGGYAVGSYYDYPAITFRPWNAAESGSSWVLDESDTGATQIRLYVDPYKSTSTSQRAEFYKWNGTDWNASADYILYKSSAPYYGWTNWLTGNKFLVKFTLPGYLPSWGLNSATDGFGIKKVELNPSNNLKPKTIRQFYLGTLPDLVKFSSTDRVLAGSSLTRRFRSSPDGVTWTAWTANIDAVTKNVYYQVETTFGYSDWNYMPRVYDESITGADRDVTYTSPTIDAGTNTTWKSINVNATGGTGTVQVRTSDDGSTWTDWTVARALVNGQASISGVGRYLQYRLNYVADNIDWRIRSVRVNSFDGTMAVWNTSALPDGNYTLKLTVNNSWGETLSTTRSVIVENTPPTGTITTPADGANTGKNIHIEGTAGDNLSGVQKVELSLNNGPEILLGGLNTTSWSYDWDAYGVPDNSTVPIRLTVTDVAGNVYNKSINITIDSQAPVTALITPDVANADGWFNRSQAISFAPGRADPSIAALWHFDEGAGAVAYDRSGTPRPVNSPGTVNGAAWVNGQFGKALDFNGSTNYATLPINALPATMDEITVEFWARVDATQNTSVLGAAPDDVNNRLNIHLPWSNGNFYWDFGDYATTGRLFTTWNSALWNGPWTHWAFTSKAGEGQAIYRNGVLVTSDANAGVFSKLTKVLEIGRLNTSYWNGALDELRIWSKRRTPAEITASMNQELTGSEANLVGYWKFNEGSGTAINDSRVLDENNHATVYGPDWAAGKYGQAMSFDGVSDYVYVPDADKLDLTTQGTVEFWVYAEPASQGYLFSKHGEGLSGYEGSLNADGTLRFAIHHGSPDTTVLDTAATVNDGRWHHVAYRFDNGAMRIFIDGVEDVNTAMAPVTAIPVNNTPLSIGRRDDGTGHFNGVIDEFSVTKTALTQPNILAIKNNTWDKVYFKVTDQSVTTAPVSGYTVFGDVYNLTGDAKYRVWYYGVDLAGNAETPHYTDVNIDANPLIITGTTPVDNGYANTTLEAYFTAGDFSGAKKGRVQRDGGAWYDMTLSGNRFYLIDTSPWNVVGEEVYHSYTFELTDTAGAVTTKTVSNVLVDRTAPTGSVQTDKAGQWVKNGDGIQVSITDVDPGALPSGISSWILGYRINSPLTTGTITTGTSANAVLTAVCDYTVNLPNYINSTMYFTLTINDKAGNTVTYNSSNISLDTYPPTITITTPADTRFPFYFKNGDGLTSIDVAGTASDVGSGLQKVEVRWAHDAGGANDGWVLTDGTANWSKTMNLPLADGRYFIQFRAADNIGNINLLSREVEVVVDRTPPVPGVLKAVDNNSAGMGGINLFWSPGTDLTSGISHYEVFRDGNPSPVLLSYVDGLLSLDGKFYAASGLDLLATDNVTHSYNLVVVDRAGNRSASSNFASALYDDVVPSTPVGVTAQAAGTATTIDIGWNPATDNIQVKGYIIERSTDGVNFTEIGRTHGGTQVIPRYTDKGLAPGQTYMYRVSAFDGARPTPNVSSPSTAATATAGLGLVYPIPHGKYDEAGHGGDCAICHNTHAASGPVLLTESIESKVCYKCHDGSGSLNPVKSEIANSPVHHRVITETEPTGVLKCVSCHNPHQDPDDRAKLLETRDKFGTVVTSGSEYCLSCHGDQAPAPSPGGSQSMFMVSIHVYSNNPYIARYPVTGIDCLYCHENHGSQYFRQTKWNEAEVCFQCHDERSNTNYSREKGTPLYRKFYPNTAIYPNASRHSIAKSDASVKCTGCHGQRWITDDALSSGQAMTDLTDPFNIKDPFTATDGDISDFCLKCHRSDPPVFTSTNTAIVPYTVSFEKNDVSTSANAWDRVTYKDPGVAHNDSGITCAACHDQHGTNYQRLVTLPEDSKPGTRYPSAPNVQGICFSCHTDKPLIVLQKKPLGSITEVRNMTTSSIIPSGTGYDIVYSETAQQGQPWEVAAVKLKTGVSNNDQLRITYTYYNVASQVYTSYQQNNTVFMGDNLETDYSRSSIHPFNPGKHKDNEIYRDVPLANRHGSCGDCHDPHSAGKSISAQGRNEFGGTQNNVSGVKVLNGAAGTTPGYYFLSSATYEYEVCYKCHSAYSYGSTPPTGYKDKSIEFNFNNASYHPVEAKATNSFIRPETFVNGWGPGSTMKCSDCHGSATGSIRGPHGSTYGKILKGRGRYSESYTDYICYRCHKKSVYDGSGEPGSRYNHTGWKGGIHGNGSMDCFRCHTPHGSPNYKRLGQGSHATINADTGILTFSCAGGCHPSRAYTRQY